MAGLNFFVSSTCYDLGEVRNQLKVFINNLGHEAILSDHNDVLYDFKHHTHVSCVNEVENADVLILIIGNRFGGEAINETYDLIDVEKLRDFILEKFKYDDFIKSVKNAFVDNVKVKLNSINILEELNNDVMDESEKDKLEIDKIYLSITHMEVLKALSEDIPIYVFVNKTILDYQHVYKETFKKINGNFENLQYLSFPGFKNLLHAISLFNFIDLLQNRRVGNSIFPFNDFKDIEIALKKQLASKFKKMLMDERASSQKNNSYENLMSQFSELKMAVLGSIKESERKKIAKNIISLSPIVRVLMYLLSRTSNKFDYLFTTKELKWENFIKYLGAKEVEKEEADHLNESYTPYNLGRASSLNRVWYTVSEGLLVVELNYLEIMMDSFNNFARLSKDERKDIVDALSDEGRITGHPRVQFIRKKVA